ncbi:MAG: pantoate--beta-alanine ligase [Thermodesulfobacteriota bacterium]
MEVIRTPAAMVAWANRTIAGGASIALVPTMGYFHEGHLSLMRRAKTLASRVVVSLFVNPLQFGPREDLARYPRDFDRDAALAEGEGVDVLFAPEAAAMYPAGSRTRVTVSGLSEGLCGATRPGHFEGVTTVVAKLFHLVKPQVAVFGQKDLQQLAVIRRMTADLNWDIEIVGHPIVREPDGLAMSSRNVYLSPQERLSALGLSRAIRHARQRVREGLTDAAELLREVREMLAALPGVAPEYVECVDETTLEPGARLVPGVVLAIAARVGTTRLIDNDNLFAEVKERP